MRRLLPVFGLSQWGPRFRGAARRVPEKIVLVKTSFSWFVRFFFFLRLFAFPSSMCPQVSGLPSFFLVLAGALEREPHRPVFAVLRPFLFTALKANRETAYFSLAARGARRFWTRKRARVDQAVCGALFRPT